MLHQRVLEPGSPPCYTTGFMRTRPIILAAGGTGGHIFPAEALAEILLARGERVVLLTDKRFAGFKTGALSGIELRTLRSGSLSGGMRKKALGAVNIMLGTLQAAYHLWTLKPKAVAGFGGYPSFPTMLAATRMHIPTLIHEQNAVLGRVNRFLARRVTRIATTFPATLMLSAADQAKVLLTGNPVRAAIRAVRDLPYAALPPDGIMQILITGGSQGATVFSQILPAALASLPATLRARLRLDQQCREADLEATRAAYAQLGVSAHLSSFFTDIPARLAAAHLVIARSGASTVTELAAAGRPALLVPYPQAMDNHQYFNANAFEDAGGGWVMTQEGFTASALSARLETLLSAPSTLIRAAEKARDFGRPDAAEKLANAVMEIAV